jgi:hypothetical protein
MVAYAGSTHHCQAVTAASVGNQLTQGEQNASLADYRTIRENERVKNPRDASEVGITLSRFAVLCQCLLQGAGDTHLFVNAMWNAAVGLQNIAPFITERYHALSRHAGLSVTYYYARIVRAAQLAVNDYMQSIATNVVNSTEGVEVPAFATMLQDLKRGTFHQSTNSVDIPEAYLDRPV